MLQREGNTTEKPSRRNIGIQSGALVQKPRVPRHRPGTAQAPPRLRAEGQREQVFREQLCCSDFPACLCGHFRHPRRSMGTFLDLIKACIAILTEKGYFQLLLKGSWGREGVGVRKNIVKTISWKIRTKKKKAQGGTSKLFLFSLALKYIDSLIILSSSKHRKYSLFTICRQFHT